MIRHRLLPLCLGAAALALTGCYDPAYPDPPTYNCNNASPEAARCPEGYACNGTRCVSAGQLRDGAVDGPRADGPHPDGPPTDAAPPDLAPDLAAKGWEVTTIAGTGAAGAANGKADLAQFSEPVGLAGGPGGELYIADALNHCVRKLQNDQVSTFAGTCGAAGWGNKTGPVLDARFNVPSGIVSDGAGKIYLVDSFNHCVRVIEQGQVKTLAGTCGTTGAGMGNGAASSAKFRYPAGVALAGGKVYVADLGNHCLREISNGQVKTLAGVCKTSAFYLGGFLNGANLSAKFNAPSALILDASGRVIVADSGNNCLRYVDKGSVGTLTGECNSTKSGFQDGALAVARFSKPVAVDIDPAGAILVTDQENHRVRRIAGGLVTTFAGFGSKGDKDGSALAAFLNAPAGIRAPKVDQVIFADSLNHKIRAIVPAP